MKRIALLLTLATTFHYASAQTPAKPATTAAKPGTTATAAKKPGTTAASGIKLPPGVTPVRGILKTAFALKYQEVKVGTGAPAEPGKLYKVHYTGWLASDGKKFDSSFDHRRPVLDKDGKPENDADGKPKLGEPEPIQFPQGRRGVIPGWDQGFEGMKVGGKRRLFIPYQLAYGELGRPPVIPPKADLIFDIELVDVTDMPAQRAPGAPGTPGARPLPPRPGAVPTPAPPTGTNPSAPAAPPAPAAKPADPTAPTVAPNSAPPASAPAPTTPPPTSPTAPPAKPANPAQPTPPQ